MKEHGQRAGKSDSPTFADEIRLTPGKCNKVSAFNLFRGAIKVCSDYSISDTDGFRIRRAALVLEMTILVCVAYGL